METSYIDKHSNLYQDFEQALTLPKKESENKCDHLITQLSELKINSSKTYQEFTKIDLQGLSDKLYLLSYRVAFEFCKVVTEFSKRDLLLDKISYCYFNKKKDFKKAFEVIQYYKDLEMKESTIRLIFCRLSIGHYEQDDSLFNQQNVNLVREELNSVNCSRRAMVEFQLKLQEFSKKLIAKTS